MSANQRVDCRHLDTTNFNFVVPNCIVVSTGDKQLKRGGATKNYAITVTSKEKLLSVVNGFSSLWGWAPLWVDPIFIAGEFLSSNIPFLQKKTIFFF